MNIHEINEILFSQAKSLRMCDKVHKQWYGKDLSAEELFDLYFRNIDFCLDFHWPNINVVNELFDEETLRENGVLIKDSWSFLNKQRLAILGDSKANIRYNAMNVGTVYVCDTAYAEISIKGKAFVVIHAYDDCTVIAICDSTAKATIIRHSKYANIVSKGQTTIKECVS